MSGMWLTTRARNSRASVVSLPAVGTHPTARGARRRDGEAHPLRPLPQTCSPGPLARGPFACPGVPNAAALSPAPAGSARSLTASGPSGPRLQRRAPHVDAPRTGPVRSGEKQIPIRQTTSNRQRRSLRRTAVASRRETEPWHDGSITRCGSHETRQPSRWEDCRGLEPQARYRLRLGEHPVRAGTLSRIGSICCSSDPFVCALAQASPAARRNADCVMRSRERCTWSFISGMATTVVITLDRMTAEQRRGAHACDAGSGARCRGAVVPRP